MGFEDAVHQALERAREAFAECFAACRLEDEDGNHGHDVYENYGQRNIVYSKNDGNNISDEKHTYKQPQRWRHAEMRWPRSVKKDSSIRHKIGQPTNFQHVGGMGNFKRSVNVEAPLPPLPSEKPDNTEAQKYRRADRQDQHDEIVSASVVIVHSVNSSKNSNNLAIPRKPLNSKSIENLAEMAAACLPSSGAGEGTRSKQEDSTVDNTKSSATVQRSLSDLHAASNKRTTQKQQARARAKTTPTRFSKHLRLARNKSGMHDAVRELQTIVEELRGERKFLQRDSKLSCLLPAEMLASSDEKSKPVWRATRGARVAAGKSLQVSTNLPLVCASAPRSAPAVEASWLSSKPSFDSSSTIRSSRVSKWLNPRHSDDLSSHEALIRRASTASYSSSLSSSSSSSHRSSIISMYSLEANSRRTWAASSSSSITSTSSLNFPLPPLPAARLMRSHSVLARLQPQDSDLLGDRRNTSVLDPPSPTLNVTSLAVATMGVEQFQ